MYNLFKVDNNEPEQCHNDGALVQIVAVQRKQQWSFEQPIFLQKSSIIVTDNNKDIKTTLLRWSRFVKIINGFKPLNIFVKKLDHSDVVVVSLLSTLNRFHALLLRFLYCL